MFRLADQFLPKGRHRLFLLHICAVTLTVLVLATIVARDAGAQDLSKYGGDAVTAIVGSATAMGNFANGIPGTSAAAIPPSGVPSVAVDSAGNVYFVEGYAIRMLYVSGPVPPILQHAIRDYATLPDAASEPTSAVGGYGNVYSLINSGNLTNCASSTCGDGGPGVSAVLLSPFSVALDSAGNLYVADLNNFAVRKLSAADGTIATVAGDPLHQASTYNGDNQLATAAYLSAPTQVSLDSHDNLFIGDVGSDLVRRVDASTQIITTVAGNTANTAAGVTFCSDTTCGEGGPATSATLGSVFGVAINAVGDLFISEDGIQVVRKVAHDTGLITTIAGTRGTACPLAPCGGEGVDATTATLNNPQALNLDANGGLIIADVSDNAIRGVTTDGKIYTLAGVLPQPIDPATGSPGVVAFSGAANTLTLMAPGQAATDPSGNLIVADGNPFVWKVAAPSVAAPQTITFTQIPNTTYGAIAFDLTRYATTNSGLALTFTCSGPVTCSGTNNATLTITGAGSITVTANQAGDSTHAPATPQVSTFTAAKAPLTIRANNISFAVRSAATLPPLTFAYAGFVNGDANTAVTGAPVLATSATATSPVGSYPITVALGTLAAPNYTFTLTNGTLTVTGGAPQTITFGALPNVTYGVATFTLAATASSGAPITYSVSGPAALLGSAVTVTGVGTVSVTANQAGDATFGPATAVTQSFQVAPAVLNIAAQPANRAYNAANPTFTYLATGFVSADTTSVLSGAPAFSTTATATSVPGTYPLTISPGTLFASNYTFTYANSTLTIGKASQTITFAAIPSQSFGGAGVGLTATATSGLPVTFSVASPSSINGNTLITVAPGTFIVTADQPGNDLYQAAPSVSQTFIAQQITVNIFPAQAYVIPFGGDIPVFAYQFGTGFTLPANLYSGAPSITTTATSTSAPGTYPIVISQGTLTSNNYNFVFNNGTLTILPPATFILTANPPSVTIPKGQARQVTITLTPVNGFAGSVTIACNGLPAGVTCVSSPNQLTPTFASTGASPVTGTLTISAGAPVATAMNRSVKSGLYLAGWLWLPSLLLGCLLTMHRRQFHKNARVRHLLLLALMLCSAAGLIACGSSSGSSAAVQTGTTMIQVTGAGTSTSGPASASLDLSVTIQ